MNNISPFKPLPGWLIVKQYVDKKNPFVSEKEMGGDSQVSEVVGVGGDYIDDHGNKREAKVKVGDIILHIYNSNNFLIGYDKYRAVHFSQVIGIK